MKEKLNLFTIRQVIELTGVSEFTLRGWESRYNAIGPNRTSSGRRMYERTDILKIKALKSLVDQGFKISSIADLSLEELEALLHTKSVINPGVLDPDIKKILNHALSCEWNKVEKILIKKREKLSGEDFIINFLVGLLREVNLLIEEKQISVAEEHILSSLIKENLFFLKASAPVSNRKDHRFVFASPEGDLHEIGLLITATLASLARIPNIYIGPNTPKGNICEIGLRFEATHIIVSSTISKEEGAKEDFMSFINFLDRQLPKNMAFLIGGRHGMAHPLSLKRPFEILTSFADFQKFLKK